MEIRKGCAMLNLNTTSTVEEEGVLMQNANTHGKQAGRRDVNPYPLVTRFCPIRLDIFIPVALWQ